LRDTRSGTGVRSVQLTLDVLEAIALSGEEFGVTQLADRLHVTKGSVHRHLLTLVERGYLAQNPATARYGIGPKCRLLGRIAPSTDLVQVADGPMRELRDLLGHSVVLTAMTPRGALVLTTTASTSPFEIGVRTGSELSFHASAQGRVLLAFGPRPLRDRVLSQPIVRLTSRTITDSKQLAGELDRIERQGYAAAPEQSLLGINAVAVPVFDERDNCVAALAVVGSIQHLPEKSDPRSVAALKVAGQQISRLLGQGKAGGECATDLRQPKTRR
jgi:IclR family transcriptional regulator, KDG regulon repressor